MDTNGNNTQINTFSGGMDTDSSDMLIGSDSYRMAENLRYLTDADETTGELRLIEGATRLQYSNFYNNIKIFLKQHKRHWISNPMPFDQLRSDFVTSLCTT